MIYNLKIHVGEPINDFASRFLADEQLDMRDSILRYLEDMKGRSLVLDFNKLMQSLTLAIVVHFRECLENGLIDYEPEDCEEEQQPMELDNNDEMHYWISEEKLKERVRDITSQILNNNER